MDGDVRVRVRVWDLPMRLFHWTLALLVAASVVTGKFDSLLGPGTLEWHRRSGLAILALLLDSNHERGPFDAPARLRPTPFPRG